MEPELGRACRNGDLHRVLELLTAGQSPDQPLDELGSTPLMVAASVEVLDALLTAGASVEAARFGDDVLQVVISDGSTMHSRADRLAAARRLLTGGARLDRRNEHGWSRLYVASFAGDETAVDALLALGADPNDEPPPLAAACWGSGSEATAGIIGRLLAAGAELSRRDRAGWSLLHAAAMPYAHGEGFASSDGPNLAALEALITAGLPPDLAGPGGVTALMLVAGDGDLAAVDGLLAGGADRTVRDAAGLRAVDHAVDRAAQLDRALGAAPAGTVDAVLRARNRARACAARLAG